MTLRYHSSGRDDWNNPRPYTDPGLRRHHHGPIVSDIKPPLLARLAKWKRA